MDEGKKNVLRSEDIKRMIKYIAPAVVPTIALTDIDLTWGAKGLYSTLCYLTQLFQSETISITTLEKDFPSWDLDKYLIELTSKNYVRIEGWEIQICQ